MIDCFGRLMRAPLPAVRRPGHLRRMLSCVASGVLALSSLESTAGTTPRPAPAKGSGSRTLIVHTAARTPYALGHELEFLKLQLRRVQTQVETIATAEATSNKVAAADYLVVFSPTSGATISAELIALLVATRKPLLWAGFGIERLAEHPEFAGQFAAAPMAAPTLQATTYRGRQWDTAGAAWHPMRLLADSRAEPIVTASGEGQGSRLTICWRHETVTLFSAVPGADPLQPLFAEVLLDFFGVKNDAGSRLLLRIEDYQAASNHREFKRMVDFLFSRGHAFVLPITPSWRNPETKAIEDLDAAPEFAAGLRYAQQRNGRIVLRGCVRESDDRAEFWDTELDRPPAGEEPAAVREKIAKATTLLFRHGLLPVAWQTPHDCASRLVYTEIARNFSTCIERPQLNDSTRLGQGLASAITMDQYGRIVVPENAGYLSADAPDAIAALQRRVQALTQLRGTVAGCRFHAYLGFEKLAELLTALEQLRTPFLDLADLDHWVHVQGHLLLSGRGQHPVKIGDAPFVRKTFARSGRLLASLKGNVALGENTFQREDTGDYELFEFTEAKP